MEKLHFYIIVLPLFLLQFPSLVLLSSNYTLPDKYFINCGSYSNVTVDGRTFTGDLNSRSFPVGESYPIKDTNPSTDTNYLYQTARVYTQQSFYELEINQKGLYLVRLHFFAFTSKTNLANAVFDVTTTNFSLLSNFSVRNSTNSPVIDEFLLTIDVGKFRVYFMPVQNESLAFVNAIEVFLIPEDYLMDDQLHITPLGPNGTLYGLLSYGYRTVHRVNVGGESVNDTLWRNWIPDDYYLLSGDSANCVPYSGRLEYDEEAAGATEYSASDLVYKTCREVNAVGSNFSNIIWRFNVSKSTKHLLRAHFCDIVSNSPNVLNFSLSIYNKFSQLVDPYVYISDLAVPFYYDFVVESGESGFINISVGPGEDTLLKAAYLNGLEIMEFLKVSGIDLQQTKPKKRSPFVVIIVSVVSVASFFILITAFLLGLKYMKAEAVRTVGSLAMVPCGGQTATATASPVPNLNLQLKMSLTEILDATRNFDTKLLIAESGFGKVYKGTLRNGMKVAVKRSDSTHGCQGFPEFQTEIMVLSKIRHYNLVSLVGYCDEGSEMILVYEFMERGTLRDNLYNWNEESERSSTISKLTWIQRLEICIGAANGLHYLQTSSDGGIIHCDVKSTNILLDEHYVAKVTDFGLSRSGPLADDFSMGIRGSFGYLDPEYFRTLQFTDKSDVYSFGVVLLEVLCARPPIIRLPQREEVNLTEWGLFWQKRGQLENIIDPSLVGHINPYSLRKYGEIAEKCLRDYGVDRPTMGDVLADLEYALQLQQTDVHGEPQEDSTTDASLNLAASVVQDFPSNNFPVEGNDVPMGGGGRSDTTASGVFSQLRIDGAR